MLTARAARAHDEARHVPLGAIVVVTVQPLQPGCRYRRWIVESFAVTFGLRPDPRTVESWPRGYRPFRPMAHCVNLRALDNGHRETVSAHWCEVVS